MLAEAWFRTITGEVVRVRLGAALVAVCCAMGAASGAASAQDAIPTSLTGATGDPARGRAIVTSRQVGLCLLCHSGPFPEERFQGNLAPDLAGAGSRWSPRVSCGCGSSIRAESTRRRSCRRIIEPKG